ncbi:MAG: phosphotyrosine protein phosphatase [bacterium]
MAGPLNVLFVCDSKKRRSPTAERIFKRDRRMNVRAAGVGDSSSCRMKEGDLRWAQLVLVMERKYAGRLRAAFPNLDPFPPIASLDIPNDYAFMQEELIQLLRVTVTAALAAYHAAEDSTTNGTRLRPASDAG